MWGTDSGIDRGFQHLYECVCPEQLRIPEASLGAESCSRDFGAQSGVRMEPACHTEGSNYQTLVWDPTLMFSSGWKVILNSSLGAVEGRNVGKRKAMFSFFLEGLRACVQTHPPRESQVPSGRKIKLNQALSLGLPLHHCFSLLGLGAHVDSVLLIQ